MGLKIKIIIAKVKLVTAEGTSKQYCISTGSFVSDITMTNRTDFVGRRVYELQNPKLQDVTVEANYSQCGSIKDNDLSSACGSRD